MTSYVVDLDVMTLGYQERSEFAFYDGVLNGNRAIVSSMTLAEVLYGMAARGWGERRWDEFRHYIVTRHVVFDTPRPLCAVWASVCCQARMHDRLLTNADVWVAATAIYLDVPMLTHNPSGFDFLDQLKLISNAPGWDHRNEET